ncbi:MAG: hypothetical protein AB7O62_16165 [Pirellulales bacterium]
MKRSKFLVVAMVTAALAVWSLALAQNAPKTVLGNVVVQAQFTAAAKGQPAMLYIVAEVEKGWHVFSITQKKGGPIATKLKLPASKDYRLLEEAFSVSPAPKTHEDPELWPDLPLEEHAGTVVWYVPIELSPGVDPKKLQIEGKVYAQRCTNSGVSPPACVPPKNFDFVAKLGPGVDIEE